MDSIHFKRLFRSIAEEKGFIIKGSMKRRKILNFSYMQGRGFTDTMLLVKLCGLQEEFIQYIRSEMGKESTEDIMTKYVNEV